MIKDCDGMIVGACAEKISIEYHEDGKIWAAQLDLLEAEHRGSRCIVVEGDSQQAIKAIRKYPEQLIWRSAGRIGDIVRLASAFDLCSFSFVFRGANEKAHHLDLAKCWSHWLSLEFCPEANQMFMSISLTSIGSMLGLNP